MIGLCGEFSHGPSIERDRAATTMWPVSGPAVPPSASTMKKYTPRRTIFGPSCANASTTQSAGYFQPS
jgi:hypothetical protein